VRALLDRYGSATAVVAHFGHMVNHEAMEHARKELDFIKKHNITTYFYKDTNYPYRLANCVDAPIILYAKGNVNLSSKHMLSIVGTRMPSERGKDWCRHFVLDLPQNLVPVKVLFFYIFLTLYLIYHLALFVLF
jgi:predicted Rossmann fold nucleotide-binding protein DprA/Smf involved in DNA uptake